jgi:hypothetical protein
MNDYAHLRLHEATIRGTTHNAGPRRAATRRFLATRRRRRDTPTRTSAATARRAPQVKPA